MKRAITISIEFGSWAWRPGHVWFAEDQGPRRHLALWWGWVSVVVSPGYAILTTEARSTQRTVRRMEEGSCS